MQEFFAKWAPPFAFMIFVFWYPTSMLLDRAAPEVYLAGEIIPQVASPGDKIKIRWTIRSDKSCTGTVKRQVVDAHNVVWDFIGGETKTESKTGNVVDTLTREITLPTGVSKGQAFYRAVLTFTCNPVQWMWPIVTTTPSLFFTVR